MDISKVSLHGDFTNVIRRRENAIGNNRIWQDLRYDALIEFQSLVSAISLACLCRTWRKDDMSAKLKFSFTNLVNRFKVVNAFEPNYGGRDF